MADFSKFCTEGSVVTITQTLYESSLDSKLAIYRAIVIKDGQWVPCTLEYQELIKRRNGSMALAEFRPSW